MIEVEWSLGGFNVCYFGKYNGINAVEKDINVLSGSSDLSGFGIDDWFLIGSATHNLEFMLFQIPSVIGDLDKAAQIEMGTLNEISLYSFIKDGKFVFKKQAVAFFHLKKMSCWCNLLNM